MTFWLASQWVNAIVARENAKREYAERTERLRHCLFLAKRDRADLLADMAKDPRATRKLKWLEQAEHEIRRYELELTFHLSAPTKGPDE